VVHVERTFTVQAPLQAVVDYLTDFKNTEEWDPGTKSTTRTDSGPVETGAQWHNVSEFRGRETELDYTLTEREAAKLVFVGKNKTVTSTDDLSFTPSGDATSITYRVDLELHGVAKLADPFVKRGFEKLADETVAKMTTVLERLPGSG
jgi:carbon monoxide dehydrogenase subunit G